MYVNVSLSVYLSPTASSFTGTLQEVAAAEVYLSLVCSVFLSQIFALWRLEVTEVHIQFIYLLGLSFWSRADIFNGVVTNDGVREGGGRHVLGLEGEGLPPEEGQHLGEWDLSQR